MNHSINLAKQIERALKEQGLQPGEQLEEMTDHFLTEIEVLIVEGWSSSQAEKITFEKIKNTDFSPFQQRRLTTRLPLFLTIIVLLSAGFYYNSLNRKLFEGKAIPLVYEAPSGWPLYTENQHITSSFGIRKHPIHQQLRLHSGIDIKAAIGAEVLATGKGVVEEVGFTDKRGLYVVVKHNEVYASTYNHLREVCVKENVSVEKYDIIGEVGMTGASLGPHLHYEILQKEQHVDPLPFARS